MSGDDKQALLSDYFLPVESVNGPSTPTPEGEHSDPPTPQVHWFKFALIIYFIGCGGPYGFEEAVGKGFPLFTLFFILIVPFIWTFPIALVTAELATMLPSNEGAFAWIREGLGPRIAFMSAHLYWINWVIDMALYPVLITDYVKTLSPVMENWEVTYFFPLLIILIVLAMNLIGVDLLANVSAVISVVQMVPFFIILGMVAWQHKINPRDWLKVPYGQFDLQYAENLSICFQITIWSFSGYDAAGSMIEELKDAKKNLLKSLALSVLLSIATYVICLIGLFSINDQYELWGDGYFTLLALQLGGAWLYYMTIVAAILGLFGTYNAIFFPTSQQLCCLGQPEFLDLPFLTYKHPKFNTPWIALFINAFITAIFCILPFDVLVQFNNVLYGFTLLLVFLSCVILRYSENGKNLERPIRASESNFHLYLLLFWPTVICIFLILMATITNYWIGIYIFLHRLCIGIGGVVCVLGSFILLHVCEWRKRKNGDADAEATTVQ